MDSKLILEAARGTLDGTVRAGLATGSTPSCSIKVISAMGCDAFTFPSGREVSKVRTDPFTSVRWGEALTSRF
jgi:hypothetical protein